MRKYLVLVALLLGFYVSADPVATSWKASLNGVGLIRVGMSVTEVATAAGEIRQLHEPDGECYFAELVDGPDGLSFMFHRDRVVRIDIDRGTLKTISGVGIGDTEARVYEVYEGQIESKVHKYTEGNYLYFRPREPADQRYGLVFETDGENIVEFRVGHQPQVQWVEGCS